MKFNRTIVMLIILFAFALIAFVVSATDYYVNGDTGDDGNTGLYGDPFETVDHGVTVLTPGDTLYIDPIEGAYVTYVDSSRLANGTAANWITITSNSTEEKPNLIGTGNDDGGWNVFALNDRCYIYLDNLSIMESIGDGLNFEDCHNITVCSLFVYDITHSGINFWKGADMIAKSCDLMYINNYPVGEGTSYNEGITISNIDGFLIDSCQIQYCGKECIDAKSGSRNGVIRNCLINNQNSNPTTSKLGIYIDGYNAENNNISVYNNVIYGNGTGIAIGAETATGSVRNITIFNNIVYTEWLGFHIPGSYNRPYDNITIINNDFFVNNGWAFKIDESEEYFTNLVVRNNVFQSDWYYQSLCVNLDLSDLQFDHNLFYNSSDETPRAGWEHDGETEYGDGSLATDPLFIWDNEDEYPWLSRLSPCVDNGSNIAGQNFDFNYSSRPYNGIYDIGVFEFNPANPTDYYVSTEGNDSHTGLYGDPFASPEKGVSVLKPGDTLHIDPGGYVTDRTITSNNLANGTAEYWITIIANDTGDPPSLELDFGDGGYYVMELNHTCYVRFEYIEFSGDSDNGVGYNCIFKSGCHNITMKNCSSYSSNGSIFYDCEDVNITGGEMEGGIALLGANRFLIQNVNIAEYENYLNTIEISNSSRNGIIRDNLVGAVDDGFSSIHVYGNDGIVDNVSIYNNVFYGSMPSTCSKGISLAAEGVNGYLRNISIFNNLISMQFKGIGFYISGSYNRPYDNITIINNDFYTAKNYSFIVYESGEYLKNFIVRNNVFMSDWYYQTVCNNLDLSDWVFDHNLFYNSTDDTPRADWETDGDTEYGIGSLATDPLIELPYFYLGVNSPCINNGSSIAAPNFDYNYTSRPVNGYFDIGVYEFAGLPYANTKPTSSNPNPANGSIGFNMSNTTLSIYISDANGNNTWGNFSSFPSLGTDSWIALPNGTKVYNISGLQYGTTYTWWVNYSDGNDNVCEYYTFKTVDATLGTSSWWDYNYKYRKRLEVNSSQVPVNQYNLPVLVYTPSDANISSNARSDGLDIVFVENTTVMKYEIEYYDNSTGELVAWVNLSFVNSTSNSFFYIYYGNPLAVDLSEKHNVWKNGYLGVWHMTTNASYPSRITESTSNDYAAVRYNSPGEVDGLIYKCQDLTIALKQWLRTIQPIFDKSDTSFTFSIWVKNKQVKTKNNAYMATATNHTYDGEIQSDYKMYSNTDPCIVTLMDDGASSYARVNQSDFFSTTNWSYVCFVRNGNNIYLYVNGSLAFTDTTTWAGSGNTKWVFGRYISGGSDAFASSYLDEARIMYKVNYSGQLKTEYNMVLNKTGSHPFIIWGNPETSEEIILSNVFPSDDSENIIVMPMLHFSVTNSKGNLMNYTISSNVSGAWNILESVFGKPNGTYYYNFTLATKSQTVYYWSVSVEGVYGYASFNYSFRTKTATFKPTSFLAKTYGDSQINLSWVKGTNATRTVIRRSTSGYPATPYVGTLIYNNTGTSTIDASIIEGYIYYYRAWSWNQVRSDYSPNGANASNSSTVGNPLYLEAHTNFPDTTINLTWAKNPSAYKTTVCMKTGSYPSNPDDNQIYNDTGSFYSPVSISDGTTYYLRAWSWNTTIHDYSLNYTSLLINSMYSPTDFTSTGLNDRKIKLDWDAHEDYTYIVRKEESNPSNLSDGVVIYNSTGETFTDILVSPYYKYYYRAWGYSSTDKIYSVTPVNTSILLSFNPPTNIHATRGFLKTTLTWNINRSSNRTVIIRKQSSSPTTPYDGTEIYNGTGNGYNDTDLLTAGKRYYYAFYSYVLGNHPRFSATSTSTNVLVIDDTSPPYINVNFTSNEGFYTSKFGFINVSAWDNSPGNINITILVNGEYFQKIVSNPGITPTYKFNLSATGFGQIVNITATDIYNNTLFFNHTYYVYSFDLYLVNEVTGLGYNWAYAKTIGKLTHANLTIVGKDITINLYATQNVSLNYTSMDDDILRFRFIYENVTIVKRDFNIALLEINTSIGLVEKVQDFYQQIFFSTIYNTPVILMNARTNCYVMSGYTTDSYQSTYIKEAVTIDEKYNVYTFVNHHKVVLSNLEGDIATSINLDFLSYSNISYNVQTLTKTLSVSKYGENILFIYYQNDKSDNVRLDIFIYNNNTLLLHHVETTTPNDVILYYNFSNVSLDSQIFLIRWIETKEDGKTYTYEQEIDLSKMKPYGLLTAAMATIISIIFAIFGLTLTTSKHAFGYIGIIILFISLVIVSLGEVTWYTRFFQFLYLVLILVTAVIYKQENVSVV